MRDLGSSWETEHPDSGRGSLLLTTGAITGIDVPVTPDGQRLTGLLKVSSHSVPASELGGPLFNLSGQVLGQLCNSQPVA
jgi:hypothetical protein